MTNKEAFNKFIENHDSEKLYINGILNPNSPEYIELMEASAKERDAALEIDIAQERMTNYYENQGE